MAENADHGCTVKQAAELGWDKTERILAYRGRTIDTVKRSNNPRLYMVEYDCGQADLLMDSVRLDVMVPLEVAKQLEATIDHLNAGMTGWRDPDY